MVKSISLRQTGFEIAILRLKLDQLYKYFSHYMVDQMRLDAEFEMADEDNAMPFLPIRKEEFRAYDFPMAISEIMSRLIK